MPGKYTPLESYLLALPATRREISLSFKQIEAILKSSLPASAYEDRRWWDHETEGNHVNKRAWANAGWKVKMVDVSAGQVEFIRK